jgi:hypothetical protein
MSLFSGIKFNSIQPLTATTVSPKKTATATATDRTATATATATDRTATATGRTYRRVTPYRPTSTSEEKNSNSGDIQDLADLMQYYNNVDALIRRMDTNLTPNNNNIIKKAGNEIIYIDNSMTIGNNQICKPSVLHTNDIIDSNKCFFISLWHLNKDFFIKHGYYSPYSLYISSGYYMIERNKYNVAAISNDTIDESAATHHFDTIGPLLSFLEKRINKPVFLHCLESRNEKNQGYYNYAFSNETNNDINNDVITEYIAYFTTQINNSINDHIRDPSIATISSSCDALQTGLIPKEKWQYLYVVRRGRHFPNAADRW